MTDSVLSHSRHTSPVGLLHLLSDGPVLVALDYDGYEERALRLLKRHAPNAVLKAGKAPRALAAALDAYFAGEFCALDGIEVRTGGTPFQQQVWCALRAIPAGETRSYGGLAAELGVPRASRAVGLANGSNPIAIVVPCHRVIGANGALTGYAGGLERKRYLLAHERMPARAAA